MIRKISASLYALTIITLIGSTGWMAGGMKSERQVSSSGVGIVLLAALQR